MVRPDAAGYKTVDPHTARDAYTMNADFSSIYNHHEREVFAAVVDSAKDYPTLAISNDLLCDVACVALNRLGPRYIRHEVDFQLLPDRTRAPRDRQRHQRGSQLRIQLRAGADGAEGEEVGRVAPPA